MIVIDLGMRLKSLTLKTSQMLKEFRVSLSCFVFQQILMSATIKFEKWLFT